MGWYLLVKGLQSRSKLWSLPIKGWHISGSNLLASKYSIQTIDASLFIICISEGYVVYFVHIYQQFPMQTLCTFGPTVIIKCEMQNFSVWYNNADQFKGRWLWKLPREVFCSTKPLKAETLPWWFLRGFCLNRIPNKCGYFERWFYGEHFLLSKSFLSSGFY